MLPSHKEILQQIIQSPSISSTRKEWDQSNIGVVNILANILEDLNFNVEVLPLPEQPNKANLIATLGSGTDGLVLSGHTDTVPYDAGKWDSDPFTLTEKDDKWYGLGVADMKGFFPIAIHAAKAFTQKKLKQPIILLATADEECTMAGVRALMQSQKPNARYALIGEPSSLKPIRQHKSFQSEKITIIGQSGHSSDPSLGKNAIEAMNAVINAFIKWRDEIQQQYTNTQFSVPFPTFNLGHIHGGDNPNRICGQCELTFDCRLLPEMDNDEIKKQLHERLQSAVNIDEFTITLSSLSQEVPAMHTSSQSDIVKAVELLTQSEAQSTAFATEGPFLNQMGMESVIFGPGDLKVAHQPNEYLELKTIRPMQSYLEQLINHFCLADN